MFFVIILGLLATSAAIIYTDVKHDRPPELQLIGLMKRIATKNSKDHFVLKQKDDKYAYYLLDDGSYTISIIAGADFMLIKAQSGLGHMPLVDARYDNRQHIFTEKRLSNVLGNSGNRKYIDTFLAWAVKAFHVDSEQLLEEKNDEFGALIKELEKARAKDKLTTTLDQAFKQIIPDISYLLEYANLISDVDYEYQVKETLIRDVRKLLLDYSKLVPKQQLSFELETLQSLRKIQDRMVLIKKHIESSKEFDIKKTITVIDERYEN